jgi:hypothetical protein
MKNKLFTIVFILFAYYNSYSQVSFVNSKGDYGIRLSDYANINPYKGSIVKANRQIYQTSLLISTGKDFSINNVNDLNRLDSAVAVSNPQKSLYELTVSNSNESLMPGLVVKTSIYGWQNRYSIIKYTLFNNSTKAIVAKLGLEVQPNLDAGYGNENISYLNDSKIVMMNRALPTTKTKLGIKFQKPVYALHSFDWYPEYDTLKYAVRDSLYWSYANNKQINSYTNVPSSDGQVVIIYFDDATINPSSNYDVFFAYALATTQDSVVTMLNEAETKFNDFITPVEKIVNIPADYELYQNYPNPFNPSTNIKFSIPKSDFVTLNVYNLLGQKVATLVENELTAGTYNVKFDANNLNSGIYFYELRTSSYSVSRKMLLVK